jgi:hypothetical protein
VLRVAHIKDLGNAGSVRNPNKYLEITFASGDRYYRVSSDSPIHQTLKHDWWELPHFALVNDVSKAWEMENALKRYRVQRHYEFRRKVFDANVSTST